MAPFQSPRKTEKPDPRRAETRAAPAAAKTAPRPAAKPAPAAKPVYSDWAMI